MLAYQREYLKPCPTLSESGASNKIVNEIKALKAKRSKYFIQRMLANGSDFGKLATLQKELDEKNEALLEKYERYEYLSELV